MNSEDQFEKIVSEHYEGLFRFAMSLTHVEADARDLTQQTFYVWTKKGHQIRDASKAKTWLFTTLYRDFLAMRRKQLRCSVAALENSLEQLPDLSAASTHEDNCSRVLHALAHLDEVYQAAVTLFYLDECSYKEIAVILEVPIGTVKSRIARGIARLRRLLLAPYVEELGLSNDIDPSVSIAATYAQKRPASLLSDDPSLTELADTVASKWDLSATDDWELPSAP